MNIVIDWNKNNKVKRRISGLMAAVLILTTVGTVTFMKSKEVAAKETLDSITRVVNSVSKTDPYNILEIVPDTVSYNIVLRNSHGEQVPVSGDQIMGFTGYYIGGQEPVKIDVKNAINDREIKTLTIDGIEIDYIESTLSDSNLRYELADTMLRKLADEGILNGFQGSSVIGNNARSVMTGATFSRDDITHIDGYYEGYESEWSKKDLDNQIKEGNLHLLNKDYDGKGKLSDKDSSDKDVAEPYIDEAKGSMDRNETLSGDYIMTYAPIKEAHDKPDIASDFISSFFKDNGSSGYSKNSLKYTGALTVITEDEEEYTAEDVTEFGKRRGDFDPALSLYDQYLIDTMNSKGITAVPNVRAVFKVNEGAACGYVVDPLSVNKLDKDNVLNVVDGTPLYTYDGKCYVFAGYYGECDRLTLSMNVLSANSTAKAYNNRLVAFNEVHLNDIVLSSGKDVLTEDAPEINSSDVLLENAKDDIIENEGASDAENIDATDNITIDISIDEPEIDKAPGDDEEEEEPEEEPEEEEETDYYTLGFKYQSNADPTQTYYTVLDFESQDADNGAQYYVDYESDIPGYYAEIDTTKNPTQAIVRCDCGRGSIGLADEDDRTDKDLKNFVFKYDKTGKGTYNWTRCSYSSPDYPNEKVYRVTGAKIYYGFKIQNNEWFKQYIFDRDPEQCASLPVEVKTKEVSQVTENDVAAAKLVVVLSGDTRFCVGNKYVDYDKDKGGTVSGYIGTATYENSTLSNNQLIPENTVSANRANDLNIPAYKKIVEKLAVNKMPVICDYAIVDKANTQGSNIRGSWVYNLVRVLMLKPSDQNTDNRSGYKVYYDAIGDILGLDLSVPANRFDPGDTSLAYIDDINSCHFVNQNAYVYNMKWEKMNGGEYQNFLNLYLYTMAGIRSNDIKSFTEDEIDAGFKEVIEDIRSENRFRIADNRGDKQIPEYITQATVIRYIIGFANKRERNIKGKLRVLEIEPTNSFDLYIDDTGNEYNNFGMSGYSYSTKKGFKTKSRSELNNDNLILFRNGTYESVTGNNNHKPVTGKVYRRNGWKDVSRNAKNTLINLEGIDIELTRMSVAELIGHIEDLNAQYDVIYIGMNTQLLGCVEANGADVNAHRANKNKELIPDYNDTNMRGMVYTNIGDIKRVHQAIASDDTTGRLSDSEANSDTYAERYSGNDITEDYAKKLVQFVDASYPVILDDDFFLNSQEQDKTKRQINTAKIDPVSYMYLLTNTIKSKQTVYSVSDVKNDKDGFFEWLLNLAKPEIVIKADSPAFEATKKLNPDDQALTSDPDNFKMYGYEITLDTFDDKFHLPFEFSIKNAGAASSDSKYKAELYVDLNADGKYSSRELIDFTSVRENGYTIDSSASDLRTGYDYYAQCQLASSFEGVVPWRLVVYQLDHPERRSNATGYYTLKKPNPTHIKVLQLNQRDDRSGQKFKVNNGKEYEEGQTSTWNMANTAYKGNKYMQKNNPTEDAAVTYSSRLKDNSTFASLLKAISSYYEVEIITESVDKWEQKVAAANGSTDIYTVEPNRYYEDLRKYDMLILGFADCYMGPKSENAMAGIAKYIKSERSTLFTHDCASYHNFNYFEYGIADRNAWHWGYYFNKHIGGLVGMDRYGKRAGATPDPTYHKYDVAIRPGTGTRTGDIGSSTVNGGDTSISAKGYANWQINYYAKNKNNYSNINGITVNKAQDGNLSNTEYGNIVTQVNDGQITKFPFALHESFPVSATHNQYYQLDFTDDADHDNEKDIVVWYCISDAPVRDFEGNIFKTDGNGKLISNGSGEGGDLYEMSPNDVRNNYYIYNKGNVVYTGVGHHRVCDNNGNPYLKSNGKIKKGKFDVVEDEGVLDNTDEMKLFINTMIAAYQRGIRQPSLKAVSSYTDASATGNVYVSYDQNYNNDTGIMDSDINLYFQAARSNYNTSDEGYQESNGGRDKLNIRMYWEATEQEKNEGTAVEITPLSIEYDASNASASTNGGEGGYEVDPSDHTGIYGIPVSCTEVDWWDGSTENSLSTIISNGATDLIDNRVYKATISGVDSFKSSAVEADDAADKDNNIWYKYDASVDPNTIKGKSLNNRRIILVITNDTYNSRTDIGRKESTLTYVTLTRAKMFMIE